MPKLVRSMTTPENRRDHLAEIGGCEIPPVNELKELEPVIKERRILPLGQALNGRRIADLNPVETSDQLQPILTALRTDRSKYFECHTPAMASMIGKTELRSFEWQANGEESWQPVTLPHYGEPVGPAETRYRTTFRLEPGQLDARIPFIRFTGVDYKAHVFINDQYVGSHEGFFSPFAFDISRFARPGDNTLLVRVENDFTCLGESQHHKAQDIDGDKIYAATNHGYDEPNSGWHHCPPGMGIHGKVFLEMRPPVHLDDIFVRPLEDLKSAEVWIEVLNTHRLRIPVRLSLSIYGDNFKESVIEGEPLWNELQTGGIPDARDNRLLEAGVGRNFYRFRIDLPQARKWTPGTPWLYQAQVALSDTEGKRLDNRTRTFGMRWFSFEKWQDLQGMPMLNGDPIRLRGANTMGHEQRCVMTGDLDQLREDLLLAKACHMNFLRFTQRPVQEEVYDACDRMGILTQTDLPLFAYLRRNQFAEALRQCQEMERIVRSHPCNVLISYINEPFPDDRKRRTHRHLIREDLERFFHAATEAVHVENPDRMVKPADGDYNPPTWGLPDNHCYTLWYQSHGLDTGKLHKGYWLPTKSGWHYGCGEYGAEGLDTRDLMERLCPPEWLPSGDEGAGDWTPAAIPRAQSWKFGRLFYDKPGSADEWIRKSRQHQANATRIMTEAFRRDPRNVSSAIHLFIDAWPTGWMKAIVDTERCPKPAYFAYREALTPLMISLRSDRDKLFSGENHLVDVWICNDSNENHSQGRIEWRLMGPACAGDLSGSVQAVVEQCRPTYQGTLSIPVPDVADRTRLHLKAVFFQGDMAVHQQIIHFEAFPKPAANPEFSDSERVRFCTDQEEYQSKKDELDAFVNAGGRLVLLEFPQGEYEVAGNCFSIRDTSMAPRYFVSRGTGHPLVEGLMENDFAWWYDLETDRPGPVASTVVVASTPAIPVITTTNHGWLEAENPLGLVVAEFLAGEGSVVVSQLHLSGRIRYNPTAWIFADRLSEFFPSNRTFSKPRTLTHSQ